MVQKPNGKEEMVLCFSEQEQLSLISVFLITDQSLTVACRPNSSSFRRAGNTFLRSYSKHFVVFLAGAI